MNTLSSILKWIGNTIGANPNTLTTTDKTIVGAINEVRGGVYGKDAYIVAEYDYGSVAANSSKRANIYSYSSALNMKNRLIPISIQQKATSSSEYDSTNWTTKASTRNAITQYSDNAFPIVDIGDVGVYVTVFNNMSSAYYIKVRVTFLIIDI